MNASKQTIYKLENLGKRALRFNNMYIDTFFFDVESGFHFE